MYGDHPSDASIVGHRLFREGAWRHERSDQKDRDRGCERGVRERQPVRGAAADRDVGPQAGSADEHGRVCEAPESVELAIDRRSHQTQSPRDSQHTYGEDHMSPLRPERTGSGHARHVQEEPQDEDRVAASHEQKNGAASLDRAAAFGSVLSHGSAQHGSPGSEGNPIDRRTFLGLGGAFLAAAAFARAPTTLFPRPPRGFRFLVDDPRFVYSRPCFSPSGDRVLFMRAPATQDPGSAVNSNLSPWEFWTVPLEGGPPSLLFRDPTVRATRPDWSPVTNRIAFTGITDRGATLWILSPETGESTEITLPHPYRDSLHYPSWYPDGERLALTHYHSHTLLEVWPERGEARPLTDPNRIWAGMGSVAPDRNGPPRIAFAGQRPGRAYSVARNRIWIRSPSGRLRALDSGHGRTPWWSPTGDRIALSAVRTDVHPAPVIRPRRLAAAGIRIHVQRMSPGGQPVGKPRAVSPPDHAAIHPKWHPSERLLVCTMDSLVTGHRGVALLSVGSGALD